MPPGFEMLAAAVLSGLHSAISISFGEVPFWTWSRLASRYNRQAFLLATPARCGGRDYHGK